MSHGEVAPYNSALLNYLLRGDVAGTQLYDVLPPVSCILLATTDSFYWFVETMDEVEKLSSFINGLSNHSITCGDTMGMLTTDSRFTPSSGHKMTEIEYKEAFEDAEAGRESIDVIMADAQSGASYSSFIQNILRNEKAVATAGPSDEETEIGKLLQQDRKVTSVNSSLLQLIFGHVDAGAILVLQEAAG